MLGWTWDCAFGGSKWAASLLPCFKSIMIIAQYIILLAMSLHDHLRSSNDILINSQWKFKIVIFLVKVNKII